MKLATSTQVIYAKKKRMVLCFLLLAGMISSLIVYFPSSKSNLIEYARAEESSLSQYFQQVNFTDFKNRGKTENYQEGQNQMPQSDQVLNLQRQVPKPLDSTYPREHILVQSDNTESEIPKLPNDSILKHVSKLPYMQPEDEDDPKGAVDDQKQQFSRTVNIYDISKPSVFDPNSCVRTTTPKRFIICTYSKMEDIYVSGDILKYGQWEGAITRLLYNILSQDRPITFLDIGANIGYFSLLAAAAGQSVISVEPTILHIQKLTSSIHANKFENNITVLNNAVSNERRTVKMDVSNRTNKGTFRLVSDSEHLNMTESVTVKSILLDDLADLIFTPYIVLKLDIEGHECRVLERSEHIFNRFKVLLITMEWRGMQNLKSQPGVACPEQNIQWMVKMLTRRGFVPYSFIDNQPLNPRYNDRWDNIDVYWKPRIVQNTGSN
ncbi:uncharacterized protein LOC132714400 [Ruditapes philippinarum]|uniref:uncharacterized protein LOC132714400 n=1 Tax=Ruditapes philippinarum TaxID=129788 RepID=UPI00295A5FC4|nr:uncharacterized protein LOC132714400 [Ruditapes philippinarum]